MRAYAFEEPRHDYAFGGGWSRRVSVGDRRFIVGVERGKRVRIAYKPRGPGAYGFRWHGFVRDADGREVWSGEVGKNQGVRGLLTFAGVLSAKAQEG